MIHHFYGRTNQIGVITLLMWLIILLPSEKIKTIEMKELTCRGSGRTSHMINDISLLK